MPTLSVGLILHHVFPGTAPLQLFKTPVSDGGGGSGLASTLVEVLSLPPLVDALWNLISLTAFLTVREWHWRSSLLVTASLLLRVFSAPFVNPPHLFAVYQRLVDLVRLTGKITAGLLP